MTQIPSDPETLLPRKGTADALTKAGYRTAPASLATLASRGGGPPFVKYGRWPLYRWGSALAWAQARLSPVVTSTSELDALTAGPQTRKMAPDEKQVTSPDNAESTYEKIHGQIQEAHAVPLNKGNEP